MEVLEAYIESDIMHGFESEKSKAIIFSIPLGIVLFEGGI